MAGQFWDAWSNAFANAFASGPGSGTGANPLGGGPFAGNAHGGNPFAGNSFAESFGHFQKQTRDWYGQMQALAGQFAGKEHTARDIAQAWRKMLADTGTDAFDSLLKGMRGPGLQGMADWSEAAAPWVDAARQQAESVLGMPAFGFTREHQERAQAQAQAQLRWQKALGEYQALLAKASQDACDRFESKLAEREEPGRQIGSVRALFDLWVDAAEEAHAETALSTGYRHAYGELVNAQMQLRAATQAIAEQAANLLGLPGRTELDSAHRKIAELERQLRRLQRAADAAPAPRATPARPRASKQAAAEAAVAEKPAAKKSAGKVAKKAAKKPAKKVAAGQAWQEAVQKAVKKTAGRR